MVGKVITGMKNSHQYMEDNDILLHLLLAQFKSTLIIDQMRIFSLTLKMISRKSEKSAKNETEFSAQNVDKSDISVMKGELKESIKNQIQLQLDLIWTSQSYVVTIMWIRIQLYRIFHNLMCQLSVIIHMCLSDNVLLIIWLKVINLSALYLNV